MKPLFGTLAFCLGVYFASYSGRLIVLRGSDHVQMFEWLDRIMAFLPFVSILILLIVGTLTVLKNSINQPGAFFLRIPLIIIIAIIPLVVHMAMYVVTYSVDPPPKHIFLKYLSISEWLVFLIGFCLLVVGVIFILAGVKQQPLAKHKPPI
jgi:hypothetical protein